MTDPSQPHDSPGQTLKQARERLGMSVANVARELHLSSTQITALEADDYQHFHGETYVRGYLRSYARLIGVDPATLVPSSPAAPEQQPEVPEVSTPSADRADHRRPWLGVALLLLVAGLGYLVYVTDTDGEAEVAAPAAPHAGASAAVRTDGPVRLAFSGNHAAWVEVRDAAGRRLMYQSIDPGRATVVEGSPPFYVYVGPAHGVDVEYNGVPYDLTPHIEGMYARFVVQ